jgi:hypothetical protein
MCVGFSLCFYSQSASAVCVSLAVFVFIEYKGFVLVEPYLYGCTHRVHIGLYLMKYNFLSQLICVCI